MLKSRILAQAVALAVMLPGVAVAEFEISGAAKIEYSIYSSDGQPTGAPQPTKTGDAMKSEASVKLFINSDIGEESAFHAELLLADDGEAPDGRLEGGESYTQYEVLREFYFDVPAAGWDFRLGKQQVVWGTADGIKLLDVINPTDFRELNQNVFEDARIPVWMLNAEKYFDDGSSVQVIVSEAQPNIIAGLDASGEYGAPFIFKGVDTITGKTNGFLNIAKDMGQTSGIFQNLLQLGGLTGLRGGPMSLTTVSGFTQLPAAAYPTLASNLIGSGAVFNDPAGFPNKSLLNAVFVPMMSSLGTGNDVLNAAANGGEGLFNGFLGFMMGDATGNIPNTSSPALLSQVMAVQGAGSFAAATEAQQDNIIAASALLTAMGLLNPANSTPWDLTDDTQRAAFATMMGSLTAEQRAAMLQTPELQQMIAAFGNGTTNQFNGTLNTTTPTSAFDFMGNTTFGTFDAFIGMRTIYRKDYDTDPFSEGNLGFRFRNTTESGTNYSLNYAYRMDSNPYVEIHWEDSAGRTLNVNKTVTPMDANGQPTAVSGQPQAFSVTTLNLVNPDNTAFDSAAGANPASLVFEEKLNRINTIGMSFDSAVDGFAVPMVLRGEFSYDVATKQPIIDLDELSIGNLTGALKMEDADMFKYVLGVDITVLTNMLVSTQLIQFFNLDYVDDNNSRRYTGDFSSMHLTNGMKKGDEIETFVSVFLSKPFGSNVQHRWNNILIFENDGGYWNRFDVEYSINNDLIGLVEVNSYWGDENTMFGQFKDSSNLQLGLKYLF
jgi:hypothetical protein